MKIDKYLADSGFTSRRKAKLLVQQGHVLINGKRASLAATCYEGDLVVVNGKEVVFVKTDPIFIAYHKPKGIVCTTEKIEGNIIDAIHHSETIYPVGRLDKDSEGLILLTNQGPLIDKISNSSQQHEKEYLVTLNLPVRQQFLKEIRQGITLKDELTKPCTAELEKGTKRVLRIILTQGLNRQIRRMCNAYDYQVLKLQRLRVMNIHLGTLKVGEWRNLTETETKELLKSLQKS